MQDRLTGYQVTARGTLLRGGNADLEPLTVTYPSLTVESIESPETDFTVLLPYLVTSTSPGPERVHGASLHQGIHPGIVEP